MTGNDKVRELAKRHEMPLANCRCGTPFAFGAAAVDGTTIGCPICQETFRLTILPTGERKALKVAAA